MKILMTARAGGKTYQCVEYLRAHPHALMVCSTQRRAEEVRVQYTRNEFKVSQRIQPWSWVIEERKHKYYGLKFTGLVIDDLDALLQQLFEMPVEAVSLTWPPLSVEDWRP